MNPAPFKNATCFRMTGQAASHMTPAVCHSPALGSQFSWESPCVSMWWPLFSLSKPNFSFSALFSKHPPPHKKWIPPPVPGWTLEASGCRAVWRAKLHYTLWLDTGQNTALKPFLPHSASQGTHPRCPIHNCSGKPAWFIFPFLYSFCF